MRKTGLMLILLLLTILLPLNRVLAEPGYPLTITVKDPEGGNLASATVTLYYINGTKITSGTTNSTGMVNLEMPVSTANIIIAIEKGFISLTPYSYNSSQSTQTTVDLSTYNQVTIDATYEKSPLLGSPKALVSIELVGTEYVSKISANGTLYVGNNVQIKVAYPESIIAFPYKYNLTEIKVNGVKVNNNSTVTINSDTSIVGIYSAHYYLTLETWIIVAMLVIIIVAVVVVSTSKRGPVKQAIDEIIQGSRRFVKKKR